MPDRDAVARARAVPAGLCAGFLLDRALGDPVRGHPVAALGRFASAVERRCYADTRAAGMRFVVVCVGSVGAASVLLSRVARVRSPLIEGLLTAAATYSALGGTTLTRIGEQVADALEAGDVEAARAYVPSLCARDPGALDAAGICRAAVESIAENTSDAAVAPLLWGAVGGTAGLVVYRAVNTLDAMVGYRDSRYRNFGWAAARLDDLANLLPSRATAALAVLLARHRRGALRSWRRDSAAHPSPNAGVVEATFAGALGVRLGGSTTYPYGTEDRPSLGVGNEPRTVDLRRAVRLSRRVQAAAVAGSAVAAVVIRRSGG